LRGDYLNLFEFDESAKKVLWVEKQHRLAMRADTRLPITQHSVTILLEPVASNMNIFDLVTHMMNAPIRMSLKETRNR
tara:strand:+ start:237 stop:470 length:234 start_codon:yes stop_codon:yes gene_type:complete